jgi:poly(3-hydroxybutyrate) depolymerase
MQRRQFIALGAVGALGWRFARRVDARTRSQGEFKYGERRLGISDDDRDGTLYVPQSYKAGTGMPVVMWLHGLAGSGEGSRGLFPLAEELGFIVIAPESRGLTWGNEIPGFDDDVHFLGPAYRHVANLVDLDPDHVALAGVSDGAGYALSMGLAYGNVFQHLMVFSGGLMIPFRKQGKPRIFLAHGINDTQMPIDLTARKFVPQLKAEGYDVTYREYQGSHRVPPAEIREAFKWFLGPTPK